MISYPTRIIIFIKLFNFPLESHDNWKINKFVEKD